MKEFFGLNIGAFGRFSVGLVAGKLQAAVQIDSDKVVDLGIGAVKNLIPGHLEDSVLDGAGAALKVAIKNIGA